MSLSREDQRIIGLVMKAIDDRKEPAGAEVTKKMSAKELGVSFRKAIVNQTPIKVAARSPSSIAQQVENISTNLAMLEDVIKEFEVRLAPVLQEDDKLVGVLAQTVDSADAKFVRILNEFNGRIISATATIRNLGDRIQID